MAKSKNYYDPILVESLLIKYQERACTDIKIRDEILIHLMKFCHRYALTACNRRFFNSQDMQDMESTALIRCEKVLYKWRPYVCPKTGKPIPGKGNSFNFFTQIIRQTMMAEGKSQNRGASYLKKRISKTGEVPFARDIIYTPQLPGDQIPDNLQEMLVNDIVAMLEKELATIPIKKQVERRKIKTHIRLVKQHYAAYIKFNLDRINNNISTVNLYTYISKHTDDTSAGFKQTYNLMQKIINGLKDKYGEFLN